jgi:predicted SAM-dependent methyltransferase
VADCAALRECARVLRPGGLVLYTVPDLRRLVRWWLAVSRTVGLRRVPFPADGSQPALRLLAFRR